MSNRLKLLYSLPLIAAWAAGNYLWFTHRGMEKRHQAYLQAWDTELEAAKAKKPEPDGRDHVLYLKQSLEAERECRQLDAQRRLATDTYLAELSLLMGLTSFGVFMFVAFGGVYFNFLRHIVETRMKTKPDLPPPPS